MDENNVPGRFIPIMKAGKPIQTPTTLWEKWIFYSYVVNEAPHLQFLLPILHMLGCQDTSLRKWESEFFNRPPGESDYELISANYKMYESYLWILSAYEIVRTLSQSADTNRGLFSNSVTEKIRKTKHKLEEIRIPLAKLEPRRGKKGETALAFPGKSENTFGWIVEPDGKFYSRRELADATLELLKFMYEDHQTHQPGIRNGR